VVTGVRILVGKAGRPKGLAYVDFESKEAAAKGLECDGIEVAGSPLSVQRSLRADSRPWTRDSTPQGPVLEAHSTGSASGPGPGAARGTATGAREGSLGKPTMPSSSVASKPSATERNPEGLAGQVKSQTGPEAGA
ncbi:unnamed protein product, partial [Discosporangium mesarthrocarpum]